MARGVLAKRCDELPLRVRVPGRDSSKASGTKEETANQREEKGAKKGACREETPCIL